MEKGSLENEMEDTILNVVGNTPIIKLANISKKLKGNIFLKMEFLNPWMSVKDRVALNIIEDAEKTGKLKKGGHVVEATSGNTGISLAGVCAVKGYKLTIILPEFVSLERKLLLRMLGADLILTPESQGLLGPVAKSIELASKDPNIFIADQTRNLANPESHLKTAEEIWEQMDGNIDAFVSASGTGGHISGIGQGLKNKRQDIKVIAVEPFQAAVLSGQTKVGEAEGNHGIIGIGPGFIPKTLDRKVIDRVIVIDPDKSYETVLEVMKSEGVLIGVSTGATIYSAMLLANEEEMRDKNIIVVGASATERYLSTKLSADANKYLNELVPEAASPEFIELLKSSN